MRFLREEREEDKSRGGSRDSGREKLGLGLGFESRKLGKVRLEDGRDGFIARSEMEGRVRHRRLLLFLIK